MGLGNVGGVVLGAGWRTGGFGSQHCWLTQVARPGQWWCASHKSPRR